MIEVLKQALDALENITNAIYVNSEQEANSVEKAFEAIKSLRQAIAELESQEPVYALWQHGETGRFRVTTPDSITDCDARWFKVGDLYTHPPQRTWVGLTDDDMASMSMVGQYKTLKEWFLAIEAKLKEKNT
jgi:hypothetical protein